MICPLCDLQTDSPLGHLLLCGSRFKKLAEDRQAVINRIIVVGHNDDCLFCGFKDRIATGKGNTEI